MKESNRNEKKRKWRSFWKYYGPILSARIDARRQRRPIDEKELENYMLCLYDFKYRKFTKAL